MKKELIKTDNYLLIVDDSNIKDGDWMHRNDEQPTFVTSNFWWDFGDRYRKITAHLPLNNAPILEGVPLLPPLEQNDDVEKIAKENYDDSAWSEEQQLVRKLAFINGYNKAKERYRYTEDDVIKAIKMTRGSDTFIETILQQIKQLKLPIGFEPEIEYQDMMEKWYSEPTILSKLNRPQRIKTIINEQGQIQLIGDYIYDTNS
jgi:hypothetical protein